MVKSDDPAFLDETGQLVTVAQYGYYGDLGWLAGIAPADAASDVASASCRKVYYDDRRGLYWFDKIDDTTECVDFDDEGWWVGDACKCPAGTTTVEPVEGSKPEEVAALGSIALVGERGASAPYLTMGLSRTPEEIQQRLRLTRKCMP